jgi:hypothetical protein
MVMMMTLVILEAEDEEEVNHSRCVSGQSTLTDNPTEINHWQLPPEKGGRSRAKWGFSRRMVVATNSPRSAGAVRLCPLMGLWLLVSLALDVPPIC